VRGAASDASTAPFRGITGGNVLSRGGVGFPSFVRFRHRPLLFHRHRPTFHVASAAMGIAAGLRGAGHQQLLFLYMLRASAVNQQNTAISVRLARRDDIPGIQSCNLKTLPENYATQFYVQHLHNWPNLAIVAEATTSGTVAANMDDQDGGVAGNDDGMSFGSLDGGIGAKHQQRLSKIGFRGSVGVRAAALAPHKEGGLESSMSGKKRVVGYVLGRMETQPGSSRPTRAGHITSLAVLPTFRRMGIAQDLMKMVHDEVSYGRNKAREETDARASLADAGSLVSSSFKWIPSNSLFRRRPCRQFVILNDRSPALALQPPERCGRVSTRN
jgi:ribosomal protein S18 acetylase RimI-like enzyme